ncbi:MAG: NAD(P)-dependent oxidoreductase, partial [Candidatus Omnitrophica bacterium]|nr:NAD(P)-dependent oxidoreductase [Candidatus Omnitrophota bacterium]
DTFGKYPQEAFAYSLEHAVEFSKAFLEKNPLPGTADRYALSKLIAERVVLQYEQSIVLRLWHVYGKGDDTNRRIPTLIRELTDPEKQAEPLRIVREKIAFCSQDRAVEALVNAARISMPKEGRIINVAGDTLIDTVDVARMLKRLLHAKRTIVEGSGQAIPELHISNDAAKEILGIVPSDVPLARVLKDAVRWFLKEGLLVKTRTPPMVGHNAAPPSNPAMSTDKKSEAPLLSAKDKKLLLEGEALIWEIVNVSRVGYFRQKSFYASEFIDGVSGGCNALLGFFKMTAHGMVTGTNEDLSRVFQGITNALAVVHDEKYRQQWLGDHADRFKPEGTAWLEKDGQELKDLENV